VVVTELLDRARTGDGEAFAQLTAPYRGELQVHCYRILGSVHDAEDATQETMLAAWRNLACFEGRASIRTWLYRIATNRCLNVLRTTSRRPQKDPSFAGLGAPEPNRTGEVVWLEPYPDVLLEGLADPTPGPEARYETREAISLAFVTALQLLPPDATSRDSSSRWSPSGRVAPSAWSPPEPTSNPRLASTSPTCTPPRFTRAGCSC
jgi:RNA polymerase sigma factor (sigma-70 family)